MRPGVSLGVLGYPGVSWGNQTDPWVGEEGWGGLGGGKVLLTYDSHILRPSQSRQKFLPPPPTPTPYYRIYRYAQKTFFSFLQIIYADQWSV